VSPICTRHGIRTGRPCRRQAAEWPGQRFGPGKPSPAWPDLAPVVACWTHLTEDERTMCLEARRRYNEAVQKEWAAEREQREREAAERRAAGIPDPEPYVYEPRPCIGECISVERATGSDSDSAMCSCARCDGHVCIECGKAPAEYLFGCCEECEKITPDDGTDFEAEYGNASPELRATLNTLVGQIVAAGGPGYPRVQTELNRHMGVRQRQHATEAQVQRGVEYAEQWLNRPNMAR